MMYVRDPAQNWVLLILRVPTFRSACLYQPPLRQLCGLGKNEQNQGVLFFSHPAPLPNWWNICPSLPVPRLVLCSVQIVPADDGYVHTRCYTEPCYSSIPVTFCAYSRCIFLILKSTNTFITVCACC